MEPANSGMPIAKETTVGDAIFRVGRGAVGRVQPQFSPINTPRRHRLKKRPESAVKDTPAQSAIAFEGGRFDVERARLRAAGSLE